MHVQQYIKKRQVMLFSDKVDIRVLDQTTTSSLHIILHFV